MMRSNPSRPAPRPTTDLADPISVVLSAPRRHHVLRALASGPGGTSFDDLVVAVTTFERAGRPDRGPGETSSEVAIALHHCHLPKLAEAGIVEEDYDRGDVSLTERGHRCARALDMVSDER